MLFWVKQIPNDPLPLFCEFQGGQNSVGPSPFGDFSQTGTLCLLDACVRTVSAITNAPRGRSPTGTQRLLSVSLPHAGPRLIVTKPLWGTFTTVVLWTRKLEPLGGLLDCPHLTRSGLKLPLVSTCSARGLTPAGGRGVVTA